MRAGWQLSKLGEIYDVRDGTHDSPKYQTTGFPLITSKNLKEGELSFANVNLINELDYKKINERSRVHKGDVLFAMIGTIGNPTLVTVEPNFAIKNVALLKIPSTHSGAFLKYYLASEAVISKMTMEAKGTTQKFVGLGYLRDFPIPLPPLPEQHRIVAILDTAFDHIATARANCEANLLNARAIFESHLQAVFTQRGDGWVETTIGEVCTLKSGTTVSAALEKTVGDLPYLKVADMAFAGNEFEIVSSSRFLNISDVGKNAVLPAGTTIFPKRGGSILTNKKRRTAVPICADLNLMGVFPSDKLLSEYVYFYFLNVDMRLLGSGSSIPQINNYDIEPLAISFPKSLQQQTMIICKFQKLKAETQRLESLYQRKLQALDDLKKSLLHQAFNGLL